MLKPFLIFVLFVWLARGSPVAESSGRTVTNRSAEDLRIAKSDLMRKYMNESADPCENFYDFACGNWKTHHPATLAEIGTRSMFMALGEFDPKLTQLLSTANEADTDTERKVKNFYASCLSTASLQPQDYKKKLTEIVHEFGEMPAMVGGRWQKQDFDWLKTVAEISYKYGISIILGYDLAVDGKDHTAHTLYLTHQEFLDVGSFEENRKGYTSYIADNLRSYMAWRTRTVQKIAKESVKLEAILRKGSQLDSERMNATSVEEMHNKYSPGLDIKKLFNVSFGYIPGDTVFDDTPTYELTLIEALNKTAKRVVANYIFYHLIAEFISKIPKDKGNLEKVCTQEVGRSFGRVVTNMFYKAHNLEKSKQEIERMWQSIKSTLANILESSELSWFVDRSRENALEKLHSIRMQIPTYEQDNFAEEYAQLNIDKEDYIENQRALMSFNAIKKRASLEEEPNYLDLGLELTTPGYITAANTIIFPVSVLTTDFFWSSSHPKALKFARLGFLVSHEVMHGFSGVGRFYNKLGDFLIWWDEGIESEYKERRTCYHDQYHNYTFGGKPLAQQFMQGENAADNAGILLAYQSYQKWYEADGRTKEELDLETLPQLNYTNKQLFFIDYSQMWCADIAEEARSFAFEGDSHSPDPFRAFVPLLNFGQFSTEFNCPKGSPMNPHKKCTIL